MWGLRTWPPFYAGTNHVEGAIFPLNENMGRLVGVASLPSILHLSDSTQQNFLVYLEGTLYPWICFLEKRVSHLLIETQRDITPIRRHKIPPSQGAE
jgi:hypothetical protein